MAEASGSALAHLQYYDNRMKECQLTEDESRALDHFRLYELELRRQQDEAMGARPPEPDAGADWDQRRMQADHDLERTLEQERLRQNIDGAWKKQQEFDAARAAWLKTVQMQQQQPLQPDAMQAQQQVAMAQQLYPDAAWQLAGHSLDLNTPLPPELMLQPQLMHHIAGQLHAPVGVGAGASQPMAMGGELMTPQQLAEYQQQMSSMQQQHQAALMQHQVMVDYGQEGAALGPDHQQHDGGQDVHVDITGGEHEHHAGAYHQQAAAHGDDAAYAAMNADLMAPKACRLCNLTKPLSDFHVNNSNADKHDTRCKTCCQGYEKEKRAKKRRILEPTVAEKTCRTCNETKPATDFYRYTYSKDGLYQQCKICHAQAGQSRLQRAPPMEGKVCSKCNETKAPSEFYVSKYLSTGLHSQCKKCVRAGQERRVRCPPEKAAPEKVCRKCRQAKPAEQFYLNKLVSDGLSTYCKECTQANQRPLPTGEKMRYHVPQPTKDEKLCRQCGETKPADMFYQVRSSSDGLASSCKDCSKTKTQEARKHFVPFPTVETKTCKGCKQTKTANDFYRNRTNADGLFGKCKLCSDKQADANRRPRVRHNVTEPTVDSKMCTKCRETKPANAFNRDKTKADGLQFRCKDCVHAYMRKRRKTEAKEKAEELESTRLRVATDNLAVLAQAAEEPRPGQPGYNPMRAAMAASGDQRAGMHGAAAGEGMQQGDHHHGQDGGLMLGHHGMVPGHLLHPGHPSMAGLLHEGDCHVGEPDDDDDGDFAITVTAD